MPSTWTRAAAQLLRQIDLIPGRTVLDLVGPDLAVQQTGVEQLPENRQALLIAAADGLHVPPLQPLFIQLILQLVQHAHQLRGVDGLQDVLGHIHADGLAGILKVIKTGEHHQLGRRQGLFQMAAQLQAVHKGHLDVSEHHIGPELFSQLQGLRPILRLSHQFKAQTGPVDLAADAHSDLFLIVGQQYTVRFHGCPSFFNRKQYTTRKRN